MFLSLGKFFVFPLVFFTSFANLKTNKKYWPHASEAHVPNSVVPLVNIGSCTDKYVFSRLY